MAASTRVRGPDRVIDRWAAVRRPYLDNLKILMIAVIIAIHGVVGYSRYADGLWPYANVAEVRLSPVTEAVLLVLIVPFAVFMIALLFLVAGLLTASSLARKGPGRYALSGLLRLGVPFAVFVLVVWPLLLYALYRSFGHSQGSYWEEFVASDWVLDTGPLWFVGVLLIFSLGYAGLVWARRGHNPQSRDVTVRTLLVLAAAVAGATFLVHLVSPFGTEQQVADLNFWEWPAAIALFGLGVVAYRGGSLRCPTGCAGGAAASQRRAWSRRSVSGRTPWRPACPRIS